MDWGGTCGARGSPASRLRGVAGDGETEGYQPHDGDQGQPERGIAPESVAQGARAEGRRAGAVKVEIDGASREAANLGSVHGILQSSRSQDGDRGGQGCARLRTATW